MDLNRLDIINKINFYSLENNKKELINILCEILDNTSFFNNNKDLVEAIISITELYGYYTYLKEEPIGRSNAELIRIAEYKSSDGSIFYNSGQLSLLNEICKENKMFISAPTTFGKTKLVFEYIENNYDKLKNILFIVPTNSLSEEVYIKFLKINHMYKLGFNITTNPKVKNAKNILILTPEKYLLLVESCDVSFDLCVMDESYKIEDKENKRELINDPLNTRSSKFRRTMELLAQSNGKVVFLSPYTYESGDSMQRFFNKYNIKKIDRTDNYVKKDIIDVSDSTGFKKNINPEITGYRKDMGGVLKAGFIIKELHDPTIIYVRYPKDAYDFVEQYTGNNINDNRSDRFKKFIKHLEENYEFDGSKWYILDGLKKGIGIYVSPIPRYIKKEIIELFNSGQLNILVVTSAFAEGVNSSAKNIIITNSTVGSNIQMTDLDLLNLSGRAGRFGKYSKGKIYAVRDEIHEKIVDSINNGATINNSNYEVSLTDKTRSLYDLEQIDDLYLNQRELDIKCKIKELQKEYDLTDDDLNIALSISNFDKIKLFHYFKNNCRDELVTKRKEAIKNLTEEEKNHVVDAITLIFNEIKECGIDIIVEPGSIKPFNIKNEFIWGKFYSIHSSGNIREILKRRKDYIMKLHDSENSLSNSWINEFYQNGIISDFKLYNQAFKFISDVIEYRIPFYIGFYVSVFELYCKKYNLVEEFSYDVVEISNSLENKKIDEKYDSLIEYGFSIDTIKKIQAGNGSSEKLDDYEKIIFAEFINLIN